MATRRWLGRAAATFDKWTITVANTWAAADTGTITINGKNLTLTVGTTATTAQIAVELTTMFNGGGTFGAAYSSTNTGDQYPEFNEITATTSGSTVILTCDTAGVPVTISVSEVTAGTGTLSIAHTTTATGPNYWDDANNWDGAAVPQTGDDVYIDDSDVDILYGLAQSAVTLSTLTIGSTFTGDIGLPKTNANGYPEYRADYLAISATTVSIGRGNGQGSGRLKIDYGSVANTTEIMATGSPAETGLEAILLKGTSITSLEVHTGSVGVAPHGADTATITTLRNAAGAVQCYTAATITTVNNSGGSLVLHKSPTTLNQNGGVVTILGSAAVTTANVRQGTLYYNSSGTIATINIAELGAATVDCSGDISPRTFTTTNLYAGGRIVDPQQTITYTNGVARGSTAREISAA